jgi:hypothetical protein
MSWSLLEPTGHEGFPGHEGLEHISSKIYSIILDSMPRTGGIDWTIYRGRVPCPGEQ